MVALCIALLSCASVVGAEPPAEATVTLHQTWKGRVHLPRGPDLTPRAEHLAVRSPAEFDAFIGSIPTHRIQMKQPAPPSDEPLLKRPAIDFAKHTLLVAVRDDMYVGPEISAVTRAGAGVVVDVALPDLGDAVHAARMEGVGTYHAVLVDRVEGDITWR